MKSNWGEKFYEHYEHFFRNPVNQNVFSQGEGLPKIQILQFDKVFSGCKVFASLGLSHYANEIGNVGELYFPVEGAESSIARTLLANSIFYLVQNKIQFGRGISIRFDKLLFEFSEKTNKVSFYITQSFDLPDEFDEVSLGDETGYMMIGILISENEHDYFVEHGADKFESMIEEAEVDVYDIYRKSAI